MLNLNTTRSSGNPKIYCHLLTCNYWKQTSHLTVFSLCKSLPSADSSPTCVYVWAFPAHERIRAVNLSSPYFMIYFLFRSSVFSSLFPFACIDCTHLFCLVFSSFMTWNFELLLWVSLRFDRIRRFVSWCIVNCFAIYFQALLSFYCSVFSNLRPPTHELVTSVFDAVLGSHPLVPHFLRNNIYFVY